MGMSLPGKTICMLKRIPMTVHTALEGKLNTTLSIVKANVYFEMCVIDRVFVSDNAKTNKLYRLCGLK